MRVGQLSRSGGGGGGLRGGCAKRIPKPSLKRTLVPTSRTLCWGLKNVDLLWFLNCLRRACVCLMRLDTLDEAPFGRVLESYLHLYICISAQHFPCVPCVCYLQNALACLACCKQSPGGARPAGVARNAEPEWRSRVTGNQGPKLERRERKRVGPLQRQSNALFAQTTAPSAIAPRKKPSPPKSFNTAAREQQSP